MLNDFLKGVWKENPVLVLMLGMCPTLATTSNAPNALGMGLATTFVLACTRQRVTWLVPSATKEPVPSSSCIRTTAISTLWK